MGNNATTSLKEPCPNFSWIDTKVVYAEDLDIVWNHFSCNGNKTMLKDDASAFVDAVIKYEEKRKILSLDETLILDKMNDINTHLPGHPCDELTYKDFLKLFFSVLNKINITFSKDLREVYLKVGLEQSVYLHVYDLSENVSKLNDCTIHLGFGAFHTGVEIFNRELSFGYPNGIFVCKPKQASTGAIYRKSIFMGTVAITNSEVLDMVKQMKEEWKGEDYDVINANCNHFCNELCIKLLNRSLPSYLTKIADFMSLFVKDGQDIGFLDGKGSMSFSQSQSGSLNGSVAAIGDVKGAIEAEKSFDEKKPIEGIQRSSSKQSLLPQLNIPSLQKSREAMSTSGELALEPEVSRKTLKTTTASSSTKKRSSSGEKKKNKKMSPSSSSNSITPSSTPSPTVTPPLTPHLVLPSHINRSPPSTTPNTPHLLPPPQCTTTTTSTTAPKKLKKKEKREASLESDGGKHITFARSDAGKVDARIMVASLEADKIDEITTNLKSAADIILVVTNEDNNLVTLQQK